MENLKEYKKFKKNIEGINKLIELEKQGKKCPIDLEVILHNQLDQSVLGLLIKRFMNENKIKIFEIVLEEAEKLLLEIKIECKKDIEEIMNS